MRKGRETRGLVEQERGPGRALVSSQRLRGVGVTPLLPLTTKVALPTFAKLLCRSASRGTKLSLGIPSTESVQSEAQRLRQLLEVLRREGQEAFAEGQPAGSTMHGSSGLTRKLCGTFWNLTHSDSRQL